MDWNYPYTVPNLYATASDPDPPALYSGTVMDHHGTGEAQGTFYEATAMDRHGTGEAQGTFYEATMVGVGGT